MKVLIITKEPYPNGMAATKRIACYVKGLSFAGISCKVLIATRTERYGHDAKNTVPKGNTYQYIGGRTQRASNVFLRRFHDYMDILKTIRYVRRNTTNKDVIINYLREDSLNRLIIKAAKNTGAKVVRDLCEYPFGVGKESKRFTIRRKRYFKKQFPKFDGFICISQALFDLAAMYKSDTAKLIKIPIMVDLNQSFELTPRSLMDVPYAFHSGTLYEQKDGILGAIEAFAIASKRLSYPVKYVLTGNLSDSPVQVEIEAIIKKYEIQDKIIFTGYLSKEVLQSYQNGCVLMILNKLANQQNSYCFATKLGEYLISGKPVITTNVGEAARYLTDGKSAYVVEPGDVQILAEKIVKLFNDSGAQKKIGRAGREVALANFSFNLNGERIANFFNSL